MNLLLRSQNSVLRQDNNEKAHVNPAEMCCQELPHVTDELVESIDPEEEEADATAETSSQDFGRPEQAVENVGPIATVGIMRTTCQSSRRGGPAQSGEPREEI